VLDRFGYPGGQGVTHFPPAVPSAATSVRFYHQPAFLQGGATLQLRCNLPASEIQKIVAKARPMAKEMQVGGDKFDALNADHGLPSCSFRDAANTGFDALPKDFQVFVLDAHAAKGEEPTWNHGRSCGIAVSELRDEVVYWFEDW
jgi:hypothetical protein